MEKKGWYCYEIYDRIIETLNNTTSKILAFTIHTFVIFIKESDALLFLSIPYRHIVNRRNVNVQNSYRKMKFIIRDKAVKFFILTRRVYNNKTHKFECSWIFEYRNK